MDTGGTSPQVIGASIAVLAARQHRPLPLRQHSRVTGGQRSLMPLSIALGRRRGLRLVMARRVIRSTVVTCDVCGERLGVGGGGASRPVSLNGARYVVDVCDRHDVALGTTLGDLKRFVDVGSRVRRSRRAVSRARGRPVVEAAASQVESTSGGGGVAGKVATAAVRAWLQEHGYRVGDRGRIPAWMTAAYQNRAASGPAAPSETSVAAAGKKAPRPRRPRLARGPA